MTAASGEAIATSSGSVGVTPSDLSRKPPLDVKMILPLGALLLFSCSMCPILCHPMDCSMPGCPVLHHLSELAQSHVHWVSGAIQPSHPLSSPSPPAFNLSQRCHLGWGGRFHWGLRDLCNWQKVSSKFRSPTSPLHLGIPKGPPSQFTESYSFPWRRKWRPTPVFMPGKSHELGSLVGCSPWGRKESDMTERLLSLSILSLSSSSFNNRQPVGLRVQFVIPPNAGSSSTFISQQFRPCGYRR